MRTAHRRVENGVEVPTLTVGQVRYLLTETLEHYNPDARSWTGPRYGATLGLDTFGTVSEVVEAIRAQVEDLQDGDLSPWHLATITLAERHRRRVRLWFDPRLPTVHIRRGSR